MKHFLISLHLDLPSSFIVLKFVSKSAMKKTVIRSTMDCTISNGTVAYYCVYELAPVYIKSTYGVNKRSLLSRAKV